MCIRNFPKLIISYLIITILPLISYTNVYAKDTCTNQMDSFVISPDGTLLATYSSSANSIYVFDTSTYELNDEIQVVQDRVTAITFSVDNELIGWGASDNSIDGHSLNGSLYLYNTDSQTVIATIENAADVVDQISFLNGVESLLFRGLYPGYERADIQLWDSSPQSIISKREAWTIVPAYNDKIDSIFLGTTLSLGISNEFSYQIEIWDGQNSTVVEAVESHMPISAMAFSNDTSTLATGNIEGLITLWNTDNLTQVSSFHSNTKSVEYLEFSNKNTLIAAGDEEDGPELYITIWSISSEPELLAQTKLSAIQIDADPTRSTIYILEEVDDSTQFVMWDYQKDTFTTFNLYCG